MVSSECAGIPNAADSLCAAVVFPDPAFPVMWIRWKGNTLGSIPIRRKTQHVAIRISNLEIDCLPGLRGHVRFSQSYVALEGHTLACFAVGTPRLFVHLITPAQRTDVSFELSTLTAAMGKAAPALEKDLKNADRL